MICPKCLNEYTGSGAICTDCQFEKSKLLVLFIWSVILGVVIGIVGYLLLGLVGSFLGFILGCGLAFFINSKRVSPSEQLKKEYLNDEVQEVWTEIQALLMTSLKLLQENLREEALEIYDEIIKKHGTRKEITIVSAVAEAVYSKGIDLRDLLRDSEAILVFEEYIRKYRNQKDEPFLTCLKIVTEELSKLKNNHTAPKPGSMNKKNENKMVDFKSEMREAFLKDSYPRLVKECSCAICGKGGVLLFIDLIQRSYSEKESLPVNFVPESKSKWSDTIGVRITGIFPVCVYCCKPCNKCHLPKKNDVVSKFAIANGAKVTGMTCQHIQWLKFLGSIFRSNPIKSIIVLSFFLLCGFYIVLITTLSLAFFGAY